MAWTLAPCIRAALEEATDIWPGRNKASDGTIGDASHSSRSSDHNPSPNGIVHAFDLTHDPNTGPDCNVLAARLAIRKDRRVKYIIWNRRIWNPSVSPDWRAYSGSNPHTKHMHVSVKSGETYENDVSPWWDGVPQEDDMTLEQEKLDAAIVLLKEIVDAVNAGGTSAKGTNLDVYVKEQVASLRDDLTTQIAELKAAVATVSTGGVDAATFAAAVASELADRLKD